MTGLTEVHSHILPGVDDGARTEEEALRLLEEEYEQGVRQMILTPHYRRGYFETPRQTVREKFERLCEQVKKNGMDMHLYLGAECYRREGLAEMLKDETDLKLANTRYVLLEFSPDDFKNTIQRHVTDLLMQGFYPIIAHVERYEACKDLHLLKRLINSGAYVQVNAGSILGDAGFIQKYRSRKLLKEGCVHFVGSDAHDLRRRVPCLKRCGEYLQRKEGKQKTETLLVRNPQKLLAGERII